VAALISHDFFYLRFVSNSNESWRVITSSIRRSDSHFHHIVYKHALGRFHDRVCGTMKSSASERTILYDRVCGATNSGASEAYPFHERVCGAKKSGAFEINYFPGKNLWRFSSSKWRILVCTRN